MKKILRTTAGITLLLIIYMGCISAVYFLTSQLLTHTSFPPAPLLVQILNSLLGSLLALCLFFVFRFKHMGRTRQIITQIRGAIEKIGGGDFNVRIQLGFNVHKEFEELMESINHMALDLSQLEKMRQEFISNVSHEIQSPLTSIRGFAHALRNDQLSAEDRLRYVEIIEAESRRLSQLSDSMLKLAYLETEDGKFERASFRLDQQIKDIILACEPQWTAKNIDMEVCLEEMNIKANEDLLSQVWTNIIHNSIKFTPAGKTIQVTLSSQDHSAVCRISDTGIGMTQEDQLHIFERFFKADKSRERSQGGNGLGLSIVKKIVDLHEGRIEVQSIVDTGTTFTVILPKEK